jgi:hypothetical protein
VIPEELQSSTPALTAPPTATAADTEGGESSAILNASGSTQRIQKVDPVRDTSLPADTPTAQQGPSELEESGGGKKRHREEEEAAQADSQGVGSGCKEMVVVGDVVGRELSSKKKKRRKKNKDL